MLHTFIIQKFVVEKLRLKKQKAESLRLKAKEIVQIIHLQRINLAKARLVLFYPLAKANGNDKTLQ